MYDRTIKQPKEQTVTLAVSGMLWNRSLVMIDSETKSLWSHILGRAMDGKLKGAQLTQLPSVMTDWASWKAQYPTSTVLWLPRTVRQYRKFFHRRSNQFVLGIVHENQAYDWSIADLESSPLAQTKVGDTPVIIVYDAKSLTTRMFRRSLGVKSGDRELSFSFESGKLMDEQTSSVWNPVSGIAESGQLEGKHLSPMPAFLSFAAVWQKFHPESTTPAAEK